MSIVTAIRNFFNLRPRYHTSSYDAVYSAIVARLARAGVWVGGTSGYPRVEVHSVIEAERLDKEGQLRQLTITIDSLSKNSMGEASQMNDDNLRLLTQEDLAIEGWDVIGIVPTMLQDLTETTDSHLLYRLTQRFDLFVEQVKTQDPEPAEAEEENDETQTENEQQSQNQ